MKNIIVTSIAAIAFTSVANAQNTTNKWTFSNVDGFGATYSFSFSGNHYALTPIEFMKVENVQIFGQKFDVKFNFLGGNDLTTYGLVCGVRGGLYCEKDNLYAGGGLMALTRQGGTPDFSGYLTFGYTTKF